MFKVLQKYSKHRTNTFSVLLHIKTTKQSNISFPPKQNPGIWSESHVQPQPSTTVPARREKIRIELIENHSEMLIVQNGNMGDEQIKAAGQRST